MKHLVAIAVLLGAVSGVANASDVVDRKDNSASPWNTEEARTASVHGAPLSEKRLASFQDAMAAITAKMHQQLDEKITAKVSGKMD